MHFLCNPYAVPMLYCKFHTLFENHTFLRNGMKEHKKCIRFFEHCTSTLNKTSKESHGTSWSLDSKFLVKCVESTNGNVSNEVSFLVLRGAIFGVKKDTSPRKTQMKFMTKSADIHSIRISIQGDGMSMMSQKKIETLWSTV